MQSQPFINENKIKNHKKKGKHLKLKLISFNIPWFKENKINNIKGKETWNYINSLISHF